MAKASKDDLFDEIAETEEDEVDLLESIDEDDSEGWVPEEVGEGVQGVVLKVGETRSDFSDQAAPTVTIETAEGAKLRVIGYGTVLRREILDADPHPGDLFACRYFGEKPIKKGPFAGKTFKHYKVAVRRRQPA